MLYKISVFSIILLSLSSCLMYKKADKERMDELKKTSVVAERIEIPDQWIFSQSDSLSNFSFNWIKELNDPLLKELIDEGMKYNADLLIAQEKLNQIEIAMDIAGSNLYPTVNAVANTRNNLVTGSQIQNLALKASWELDIWGKNKAGKMAAVSDYFSAQYQNNRLRQSVAAMIAKAYFLIIAGNAQERKIAQYLKMTDELKVLYGVRNKVGTANSMDLSNINAEIISLQSYQEKIKNANKQSRRTLELLVGKYPEGKIEIQKSFLPLQHPVPETFQLRLLENRPDILASHYQIEKSFYEVQVAKAARLPSVNISSSLGTASSNVQAINSLFSSPLINLGGGMVSPIFNGGRLKKNVEIKNSAQKQVVEEYAKTVLNALNEVESAWANVYSIEKQLSYTKNAIQELEKNVGLIKKQIKAGSSNSIILIQQQRELVKKEMGLIDLDLQDRIERINLYMALGASNFDSEK